MGNSTEKNKIYWRILITLASIKLAVHFITNSITGYGLHRDEYLYISESDHLAWGYMEVPPVLSVIGKIARLIFGDTEFAVRFFPALIGAVSIIVIGVLVRELGGKRNAQFIAGSAFLLSPVFLGSNNLFQPVSFNQFMWLLSTLVMVRIVNDLPLNPKGEFTQSKSLSASKNNLPLTSEGELANTENLNTSKNDSPSGVGGKYWYLLGIVAGIGFLTKYSIVFFFAAMIGGLLLTPHRKIFLTKYPYISLGIALLIAAPNLWWQISHDFPIVRHMNELAETQLVNVSAKDFIIPQFISHFATTLIWLAGLIFVFTNDKLKPYRFLGWTYLLVILILLLASGKDYYAFGAYAMLFALGGIAFEHWFKDKSWLIIPIIAILNIPTIPLAMPILPIDTMEKYGLYLQNDLGLTSPFRWEDGVVRSLRQDYADMHGWEEIPRKVAALYHQLSKEQQETCLLFAGHYGQAGVMNFYRKKYNLPETYCFNASFVAWAKEDLKITCQFDIDDNKQGDSESFYSSVLVDSIENQFARDPGYIYFKTQPKRDLTPVWKELVVEFKEAAGY